jgi:hypothetical protein
MKLKHGPMVSKQRGREPHVVIHLDVEGGPERMRKRRMRMIEIAEIGSVNGSAREKGWWKRRESLRRMLEQRSSRMAVAANEIGTEASRLDDFVGTMLAVGELSNGAGSSIAVNLDFSHDKIVDGIRDRGSGLIGALAMKGATVSRSTNEGLAWQTGH